MVAMNSRQRARQWPHQRYSAYQKAVREAAARWFTEKSIRANDRFPYIVANREAWVDNIILSEVADYIRGEVESRAGFPLHKYIHHGLSSQAMLFNLIGPLIVRNDLDPLLRLLPETSIELVTAQFEYEDRNVFNEDSGQPTSIDLLINNNSRPLYFIESKFTETEFGGCSIFSQGDCDGENPAQDFSRCYLHFIGRRYWELMNKHGFVTSAVQQNALCILSVHYQFFREVLFALEAGGVFVLLYDARNPAFYSEAGGLKRGLSHFLRTFVPQQYQQRVINLSIQQVVEAIKDTRRHEWIFEFEKKYGLQ
jgi:hypothetical protein